MINFSPDLHDKWWNTEVGKILPYVDGHGIDLGCGGRTIKRGAMLVDIIAHPRIFQYDLNQMPWPFRDNVFDWASFLHSLHYIMNPSAAVSEAVRIVRPGGYVLLILPDADLLAPDKKDGFAWDPTPVSFLVELRSWLMPARPILMDVAQPNWSFFIVIRKDYGVMGERFLIPHALKR